MNYDVVCGCLSLLDSKYAKRSIKPKNPHKKPTTKLIIKFITKSYLTNENETT